jgi:hypothetical protein
MTKDELKAFIKVLDDMNPYPVDIFPEPEDKDWKDVGKFLHKHGRNSDRIFAKWGRMVWDNCVHEMKEYLEDELA